LADGKDLSINELSSIKEVLDVHLVLERSDFQLVEEGSLRLVDLLTFLDDRNGVHDFNLGLGNLSLDAKSLEETSLLWVKSGRSGWDDDTIGGD